MNLQPTVFKWKSNKECDARPSSVGEFFAPMDSLFNSLLNDLTSLQSPFADLMKGRSYPKLDIREDGTDYVVEASVPFVQEKDLIINLYENMLVIQGKVEDSRKHEARKFVHRELSRSSFKRSFFIDESLYKTWVRKATEERKKVADLIEAKLKDGLLTIRLSGILPESTTTEEFPDVEIKIKSE